MNVDQKDVRENNGSENILLIVSKNIAAIVVAIYATGYLLGVGYLSEMSFNAISLFSAFELVEIGYASISIISVAILSIIFSAFCILAFVSCFCKNRKRNVQKNRYKKSTEISICVICIMIIAFIISMFVKSYLILSYFYVSLFIPISILSILSLVAVTMDKEKKFKFIMIRCKWFLATCCVLLGIPALGSIGALVNVQSGLGLDIVRDNTHHHVILLAVGANAIIYREGQSMIIDSPKNIGPMAASIAKTDFSKNLK